MKQNGNSKVLGIGGYAPDQIVSSRELLEDIHSEQRYGIDHDWIEDNVGIIERRISRPDTRPSDLGIKAARLAIDKAQIMPKDIGLIVYCGIDRDWTEPATAHRIQNELESNAICFDVSSACHGFINGLAIADAAIATCNIEFALVITGEIPSRSVMLPTLEILKKSDCKKLFNKMVGMLTVGDAGAAFVLGRKNGDRGFQKFLFKSDGRYAELCYYRYDSQGRLDAQMIMEKISAVGISMHRQLIDQTYAELEWSPAEVDFLICHQVGKKPVAKMAEIAGITEDKWFVSYSKYGNTTSAATPFTLSLADPKPGDKILLCGAGSGVSVSQTGLVM